MPFFGAFALLAAIAVGMYFLTGGRDKVADSAHEAARRGIPAAANPYAGRIPEGTHWLEEWSAERDRMKAE